MLLGVGVPGSRFMVCVHRIAFGRAGCAQVAAIARGGWRVWRLSRLALVALGSCIPPSSAPPYPARTSRRWPAAAPRSAPPPPPSWCRPARTAPTGRTARCCGGQRGPVLGDAGWGGGEAAFVCFVPGFACWFLGCSWCHARLVWFAYQKRGRWFAAGLHGFVKRRWARPACGLDACPGRFHFSGLLRPQNAPNTLSHLQAGVHWSVEVPLNWGWRGGGSKACSAWVGCVGGRARFRP